MDIFGDFYSAFLQSIHFCISYIGDWFYPFVYHFEYSYGLSHDFSIVIVTFAVISLVELPFLIYSSFSVNRRIKSLRNAS